MPLKVKKVTIPTIAASVLFDGTNQYLSVSRILDNSTDVTIEAWVRVTSTPPSNGAYVVSQYVAAAADRTIFGVASNLKVFIQIGSTSVDSTAAITLNTWNHLAWVRSGSGANNFSIYINGVRDGQMTYTGTFQNTPTTIGGTNNLASTYFPGYISNLRVLKGTGLYTSNFTPPNATLSAVANTSLLTCHDTSIYDASTNNFTITNNNTATVSTVSPFTVLRSVLFNGTSQYLTVANSSALQLNTGNFTIEGWIYATAFQGSSAGNDLATVCDKDGIQGSTYSSYGIRCTNSGGVIKLKADCNTSSGGGSTGAVTSTTTINTGTWYHFAYVRNGATAYLYINGTQEASAGIVDFYTTTNPVYIGYGNNSVSRFYWPGYISNFRVVKGTAVYTSSFATSTAPLTAITSCSLLTCNDQTIRDASTNNFTITNNNTATVSTVTPFAAVLASSMKFKKTAINNSVLFNGTSQYLSLTLPSALGTNNFTVEGWFYATSTSSNPAPTMFDTRTPDNAGAGFIIYINTGSPTLAFGTALTNYIVGSTVLVTNRWYHFAVVRNSNTFTSYLDGVSQGTYNATGINFTNTSTKIGNGANGYFPGYISNIRVVNGTAIYTASFTAPTSPLTAVANTSLLTCNAATIVDASTSNLTITNNGTATVSSVTPFLSTPGTFKVKKSAGVYMTATGGDLVTTSGSYKIHTFTTVGTSSFTISNVGNTTGIECLIVAGGGGGGYGSGGGGGAGGVIYSSSYSISTGSYNVVIGDGGLGNTGSSVPTSINDGKNSTFATLTALGGGGAGGSGASTHLANNGGSGGGLGHSTGTVGTGLQPSSTSGGYGNSGALGSGSPPYNAGGGGGAGGAGSSGGGTVGRGGIGITNAFINSIQIGELSSGNYYIGGGGTGGPDSFRGSSGGLGGIGGGGGSVTANNGTTGSINTGGGGGGGANSGNQNGGAGGSGIVVIKYRYTD